MFTTPNNLNKTLGSLTSQMLFPVTTTNYGGPHSQIYPLRDPSNVVCRGHNKTWLPPSTNTLPATPQMRSPAATTNHGRPQPPLQAITLHKCHQGSVWTHIPSSIPFTGHIHTITITQSIPVTSTSNPSQQSQPSLNKKAKQCF